MSLRDHDIHTGQLITGSDLSILIKAIDGEAALSPLNPPMLEDGGSGGSLSNATSYTYSYSYINWRITNGAFEILEETAESPTATLTPTNSKITVWYDPPPYGPVNGVIIYRSDAGDTRTAVTIIKDLSLYKYTDSLAGASRGKPALTKNMFQVTQPLIGGTSTGKLIPVPFKVLSDNITVKQISSGSPFLFDRKQDFLVFSVTYAATPADNAPFSVYTSTSSLNIWTHEQVPLSASSNFMHPVPVPYSEGGIRVSSGTVYVYGAYSGYNRSLLKDNGTLKCFAAKIEGPYSTPRYQWNCPTGSRAILVHAAPMNTNVLTLNSDAKEMSMALIADKVTRKLNKRNTYAGKYWRLPPARISSPSSIYAGGSYGNWNRSTSNAFSSPLIMDEGEGITTVKNEQASIFGYVIDYE